MKNQYYYTFHFIGLDFKIIAYCLKKILIKKRIKTYIFTSGIRRNEKFVGKTKKELRKKSKEHDNYEKR